MTHIVDLALPILIMASGSRPDTTGTQLPARSSSCTPRCSYETGPSGSSGRSHIWRKRAGRGAELAEIR